MRSYFTSTAAASIVTLSFALSANSGAQTSDQAQPSEGLTPQSENSVNIPPNFCPNGTIVIVNAAAQCRETDTLINLIKDYETYQISGDPIRAGEQGDNQALRQLPDVSKDNIELGTAQTIKFLARHAALPTARMNEQDRLNYDLLGFTLRQKQRLNPFDEARIPFTNDSGFFNSLSYISRQTRFQTIADYEAYAARLTQLPRFFSQNKDNMRRGIDTNFTASAEILPGIIDAIKAYTSGEPSEHAFYKPFTRLPDTIEPADQKRLKALGEAAMKSAVIPAYKDLQKFFEEEYLPKARQDVGIGTTEEGRAYYRALVRYFTTLDLSPDEVHALGQSEVIRIRGEMDAIIEEVGFKGTFAEFVTFLRTDPQFYAKSEEELLMRAAWIAKQIDGQMPRYFGKLPRLSYGVMAVPENIAKTYTTGRYWGGNPDSGRAGNYVVNTYNLTQRPLYNLPALTAHEGVPGHHHQISLSQELKDVPRFRQNLYPNAFGEGWGLYSEKLAAEMGIYKTPYERFGQLTYEMWRACRLVVDTGMHWKGWSRDQAEACFFENSALASHNIKTEVERYISWPGQALSYKIGELKILELRTRAQDALGEAFDIRMFHDAVLENGGVPLDILEAKIEKFIFQQRQIAATKARNAAQPIPGTTQ
ncbi:MAG: DUF885 domain-containing protein [Litorimonas sp.]